MIWSEYMYSIRVSVTIFASHKPPNISTEICYTTLFPRV
jgi:hypothetical protein